MPLFTPRLRDAVEMEGKTGLEDYPIFDEKYRAHLNQRILEHYDEQEIGLETPSMFFFALRRRMYEIMPKYNNLYLSERLNIDPLNTVKLQTKSDSVSNSETTSKTDTTGTGKTTNKTDTTNSSSGSGTEKTTSIANTENKARTTNSTMPQVRMAGNKDYASSGSDVIGGNTVSQTNSNTGSSSSDSAGTTTDNGTTSETGSATGHGTGKDLSNVVTDIFGYDGSQSDLLLKFRETFLNIDLDVINELGDLFMLTWNTSDSYSERYFNAKPNWY